MFKCDIKMFLMLWISKPSNFANLDQIYAFGLKRARNSIITISFEIANLIEFKLVIMGTGLCFMNFREKLLSATKYSNRRIFCSEQ